MFLFNKEDVYIGYSIEEFYQIRHVLQSKGIKYRYKVINHSAHRRGHSGSFGINPDYERQYVVSVKKDDYEEAKHIVDTVLHQ